MSFIEISEDDQQILLTLARESIRVRLLFDRDLQIDETAFSHTLQQPACSFVTLKIKQILRGCIGSTEPSRPLVMDVVHHAASAALDDPRFPPLSLQEEPLTSIEIAVLSHATPMLFSSEDELLSQLQPGIDGLTLESGALRATFLPSVWTTLPDKRQFLDHLKRKAGLEPELPAEKLKAWRYQAVCFRE
ncbi:AmmeMemoRadiSam system protein A [Porticoccus sp.]|uniref:AmmeMemoRadiSam system protein A n=1 Tax=Porticoccus sp. TaxID=2024853 RepID=UPI003F6A4FFA